MPLPLGKYAHLLLFLSSLSLTYQDQRPAFLILRNIIRIPSPTTFNCLSLSSRLPVLRLGPKFDFEEQLSACSFRPSLSSLASRSFSDSPTHPIFLSLSHPLFSLYRNLSIVSRHYHLHPRKKAIRRTSKSADVVSPKRLTVSP